jgi:hypothetical protein
LLNLDLGVKYGVAPKMKKRLNKKGRPSGEKTTLAVLRSMLTVPKRKGDYKGERVPLAVKDVAGWLNVTPDCIRCIERHRQGYRLTPENAEIVSYQTAVSEDWLLAGKPKAEPFNRGRKPYTQADFDARQIKLAKSSPQAKQATVSWSLARNTAVLAEILLLASKRGDFPIFNSHLRTILGKTLSDLTSKPLSLLAPAWRGCIKGSPARPNLDELMDAYKARLKMIYQ